MYWSVSQLRFHLTKDCSLLAAGQPIPPTCPQLAERSSSVNVVALAVALPIAAVASIVLVALAVRQLRKRHYRQQAELSEQLLQSEQIREELFLEGEFIAQHTCRTNQVHSRRCVIVRIEMLTHSVRAAT
jgi:hypothetical protein